MQSNGEITKLLQLWRGGQKDAMDQLFELIYPELHSRARGQRRRMWSIDGLDTTALVHESYLKLAGQRHADWQDRAHFLAVASTAMRHILINYVQRNQAHKRGGDWLRVEYDEAQAIDAGGSESLLVIEQVLQQLDQIDPRQSRIVEYRFFGGLSESEIACVLNVTERTIRREWSKAKAMLAMALATDQPTKLTAHG